MKTYVFKVRVVDKKIGLDKMEFIAKWKDKGEAIAKDLLRLQTQEDFKETHGHWPERVELVCINSDIRHYEEDK